MSPISVTVDRLLLPAWKIANVSNIYADVIALPPPGCTPVRHMLMLLCLQELPLDKRVAGGHDRGWGPSEPSGQPQASSVLPPL